MTLFPPQTLLNFHSSCLLDILPPLLHHVCLVLLEDHLHQTFKPLQRGNWSSKPSRQRPRNPVNRLSNFCVFLSSSACPRLTRSATRRRRGRSRSRRSCGELPTPCRSTPAQELEVCATCVSHVAAGGLASWPRALLCCCLAAIRYCDRCQVIKPDRCHHCSACDM